MGGPLLIVVVRRCSLAAILVAAMMALVGTAAAENRLHLQSPGDFVELGQPFDVALAMDFSDVTTGGAVTLAYDTDVLSLDAVAFVSEAQEPLGFLKGLACLYHDGSGYAGSIGIFQQFRDEIILGEG